MQTIEVQFRVLDDHFIQITVLIEIKILRLKNLQFIFFFRFVSFVCFVILADDFDLVAS